ncbi:MAG TPA: AroM family protein [Anaerolineae bacterium]|jgi:protein AroM|nr:AroM family protein [Anaerolineae bacterium]
MTQKLIGALTIGQSPRPDLVAPLKSRLPEECQILQAGALDGLIKASLPAVQNETYPLTTRMRDGSSVVIEEFFLAAKLQQALDQLEEQGVMATILLCAGTFSDLNGVHPLFKPFAIGRAVINSLGLNKIGLIAPIKEQEAPIRQRWQTAGFQPTVWTADLAQQDERFIQQLDELIEVNKLECIVLDYVGHPEPIVSQLRATAAVPLIDLGQLAMAALSSVL